MKSSAVFAPLEVQPAKSWIIIAEVMHSTCSQLGLQSDLWFAHQIWFWDDLRDAQIVHYITTHSGTYRTEKFLSNLAR